MSMVVHGSGLRSTACPADGSAPPGGRGGAYSSDSSVIMDQIVQMIEAQVDEPQVDETQVDETQLLRVHMQQMQLQLADVQQFVGLKIVDREVQQHVAVAVNGLAEPLLYAHEPERTTTRLEPLQRRVDFRRPLEPRGATHDIAHAREIPAVVGRDFLGEPLGSLQGLFESVRPEIERTVVAAELAARRGKL